MMELEKGFESIVRRVVREEVANQRLEIERSLGGIRDELARLNPPDTKAEQQVFTLDDIAEFSGHKTETLRKKYASQGVIHCTKEKNGRLKIARDEYLRHKTHYQKYGKLAGRA